MKPLKIFDLRGGNALHFIFLSSFLLAGVSFVPPFAYAEGASQGTDASNPGGDTGSKADKPTEDDYSQTPFTQYGEFDESKQEDLDTRFFQYGRFFGVSLGLGFEFVSGNRGALWQGGFPLFDFRLHYWFDFNFAMDIGVYTASQYFNDNFSTLKLGYTQVNMLNVGIDLKYYFDTRNLSAPISFANPFILLGVGSYTKTTNSIAQQSYNSSDTELGFCAGAGLEFTISPKKTYFQIVGKVNVINFQDTYSTDFAPTIPDLTGQFYTFSGNILFTW